MYRPSRKELLVGQCVRYEVRRKCVCEAKEYSSVLIQSLAAVAKPAQASHSGATNPTDFTRPGECC